MDEFDLIRIALFGVCMMVSIVTILKQARLAGIFGTSNKLISSGVLLLSAAFLTQTIYTFMGTQDPIWHPIIQLVLLMSISLGLGLIFFGLWKVTLFFDELHNQAGGSSDSTLT
ncbi:MAG: hypothetical protein ACFFE8_04200 [Candidatus Heimdallarchaeota archaeon]